MGFDFFLLTALDVEEEAALARLSDVRRKEAPFFAGTLTNDKGTRHNILVAQTSTPGTIRASTLTTKAITLFRPQWILLVGVAAGLTENEVSCGDILVPGWVDPYEKVKKTRVEGKQRIDRREPPFPVTAGPLVRIARHIEQTQEPWYEEIREPRPDNAAGVPAVHVPEYGVLGSGDKLLADEQAEERKYLLDRHDKNALGFEMEAAGAGLACREEAVPFAIVKGVQDDGTVAKTDLWRKYAAEAASVFVVRMMRRWEPLRLERLTLAQEAVICEKAQAEFSLRRMLGTAPSARSIDGLVRNLVDSWRGKGYGPKTIMAWLITARIESYLIPLLQERVQIEVELRRQYRALFTEDRIQAIREELINLADEEYQKIVYDAFDDTVRAISPMGSWYLAYKVPELEAERDSGLRRTLREGGKLLAFIGQSLRNAKATVSLATE